MLQITPMEEAGDLLVLKLEGELVDQWVPLLREICEEHQQDNGSPLVLDLTAVETADEQGIELLHSLHRRGRIRCEWTPFLKRLVLSES